MESLNISRVVILAALFSEGKKSNAPFRLVYDWTVFITPKQGSGHLFAMPMAQSRFSTWVRFYSQSGLWSLLDQQNVSFYHIIYDNDWKVKSRSVPFLDRSSY